MTAIPLLGQLFGRYFGSLKTSSPQTDDPVLGRLKWLENDWWSGNVRLRQAPETLPESSLHLLIRAGQDGPTRRQRQHFQDVVTTFNVIWPAIVTALLDKHPSLRNEESLLRHMETPTLCLPCLDHGGSPQWALDFTFDVESEKETGYTVHFHEWSITDVVAGGPAEDGKAAV